MHKRSQHKLVQLQQENEKCDLGLGFKLGFAPIFIFPFPVPRFGNIRSTSLRKQPTFGDATTGFPAK